jgi:hypothetical protein
MDQDNVGIFLNLGIITILYRHVIMLEELTNRGFKQRPEDGVG